MPKLIPWGNEFLVNTTITNDQRQPDVIGLSDGRFVIAWRDDSEANPATFFYNSSIRAQIFNADGSAFGAEFKVNTASTHDQFAPDLVALADGAFAVAWNDFSQSPDDASSSAVRTQNYAADGTAVGGEVLVNTATLGAQIDPAMTEMANGRYLVVWSNAVVGVGGGKLPPGTTNSIEGQVFNADGTKFGGEFLVAEVPGTDGVGDVDVTTLADGRMVVAFSVVDYSAALLGDRFTVHAQILGANGRPQGAEFLVAGGGADRTYFAPEVTALAGGGFVVAYTDRDSVFNNPTLHDSMLRVYDAAGVAQGAGFSAQISTMDEQYVPVVTALSDGRFIAVWVDVAAAPDDPGYAIRAQVFNANGTRSGATVLVNSTVVDSQYEPSVSELADGRVMVSWTDYAGDGSGWAVRAQILDPRTAAIDLPGSRVADDLIGTKFDDSLRGGSGTDQLNGAAGNDLIYGDGGNDRLIGAAGDDILAGGGGIDRMVGGGGADDFVYGPGAGKDKITDFADGFDQIDLTGYGFANLAAAKGHFANAGADCIFTFGADVLVVKGWSVAQIGAPDLIL